MKTLKNLTVRWKQTLSLVTPKFTRDLVDYISSDDGSQATVVIRGVGFTEKSALQVKVNTTTCHVITLNQTEVICQMETLPVGVYQMMLLMRPYGFALNSSTGESIFLRVQPKLVAIEPPSASEIGRSECQIASKETSALCFLIFMACFGSSVLPLPRSSPDKKGIVWLDTLCVPQSTGASFLEWQTFLGSLWRPPVSWLVLFGNSKFKCRYINSSRSDGY